MVDATVLEKMINRGGACLVVLVADMIPWRFPHQYQSEQAVFRFLRLAELAARRASLVLSISRTTSEDFVEFASSVGVKPGRMEVIHLGANAPAPQARPPAGMPEDLLSRGYVLSVSTIQVRKNHQLLYQLWRRFAEEGRDSIPRLVLVGSHGWLTDDLLIQIRTDPKVRDSIIVLNSVDDMELSWLYGHAKFTLYPSLYEGWGLPIVESLQHSTPCLASNTSSMPEASQGLATHLDPLDFMTWRQEIIRRFEDPSVLVLETEWIRARFRPRSWQDFSNDFADRVWSLANSSSNGVV
jgi:glycosyltransferase involved in cell wall biosynthesis